MAEDLQGLLDRIQKDGLDKAEARAESILGEASKKAESTLKDAEKKAADIRAAAEKDAAETTARADQALQQAARDMLLSLGQALNNTFKQLVRQDVATAMQADALKPIVGKLIDAYFSGNQAAAIDLLLPENEVKQIEEYLQARMNDALKKGLTVKADKSIVAGFKVSVDAEHVEHDLTADSIADSLSMLLQPRIAEAVRNASKVSTTS